MKKIIPLASVTCIALFLSGCGLTVSDIHQIRQTPLADGTSTQVGYKAPQPGWQCMRIDRTSESWGGDKLKAMADWQGPYKLLADDAIAYANAHQLKTNYIYLDVPIGLQLGGLSTDALTKAYMNFYQCQYPPAVSNKVL